MLLRQIKSESYGVLRYKPFHPSLSAKSSMSNIVGLFFWNLLNVTKSNVTKEQE